ncbi:ATP-binding cassette domain-containing protein [Paracoccus aestuariivivens]|uniref:Nickel import system ATP-binding protein NikD n=1 Tax=Paracoccus aestuariivivens TaxID=1820333 RepID=A0A6L6JA09_9RHOB|nr:ATP-binding cassette domain-containing protein [Paracoccus aestuariivivens]MTH78386.1 ATP-binding cassette domain-containing protein [Paracoccus aestuariivivens]
MLTIRDLSVGFRRYRGLFRHEETSRLSGLNLTLDAGEVLAVIGGSGAGKSLLAHAILGLLPPNAVLRGKLAFRGQALNPVYPPALRGRKIALIPQQVSHLDPLARTGAQMSWAARRSGSAADTTARLAALGLPPQVAQLFPDQLSGGMARRVLLAMAEAGAPDLLIADEPTAGLDPENRDAVLRMLGEHARRGAGILLITHDLKSVLPIADRVAILDEGRMRGIEFPRNFTGRGAELTSSYARDLWRALPENGFLTDA